MIVLLERKVNCRLLRVLPKFGKSSSSFVMEQRIQSLVLEKRLDVPAAVQDVHDLDAITPLSIKDQIA
jgi:hypothetical protein